MAVEHNILTDPDIHEPKGISGASAGSVYVANGAGSGAWTDPSIERAAEHATYTGANLHEPKGIASAAAGTSYLADGAGSGNHIRIQGWGQFQDTQRAVGTPTQTLSNGVRTKMICDGGFLTVQKNPSDLVNPLWNTTTNKVIPISEFDVYHLRVGFWAENYAGTTPYIDFTLDIGGGIGEILWQTIPLNKSGAVVKTSIAFPVFSGSTFFANGGEFYLTYTGTGTCDIYANDILIVRESKNYV